MKIKILGLVALLLFFNVIFFGVKYIFIEREIEKYIEPNPTMESIVKKASLGEQTGMVAAPKEEAQPPTSASVITKEEKKEADPVITKIAIVLDDLGVKTIKYLLLDKIPFKLNLAIIPGLKDSKSLVKDLYSKGNYELLLHQPMEPVSENGEKESKWTKGKQYQFMLRKNQTNKQIKKNLDEAMQSVDGLGLIKGLNNHMGSRVTSSRPEMDAVMKWLKKNGLYFLDSMTTNKSVGYELAKYDKIPACYNEVFIDGVDTPEYILEKLEQVKEISRTAGQVVAIGHITRRNTLDLLYREIPKIVEQGFKFVFISELISKP